MSKILAIDIGMGTSDVFLYDSKKNMENCIKFVVPTPLRRYLKLLKSVEFDGRHKIYICGETIGGGPLAHMLSTLIEEKKAEVYITPKAAFTIKNDPDEVRELGYNIIEETTFDAFKKDPAKNFVIDGDSVYMRFTEFEAPFLKHFFANSGEDIEKFDGICVCAQDHGCCKKEISDRLHRFSEFRKILARENPPSPYLFCNKAGEIPATFLRLNSLESALKRDFGGIKSLVMDSSPAALLGCFAYADEYFDLFKTRLEQPYLMVNMGNNHAIFVVAENERILAFYEHHSWVYDEDPAKLESHIKRFCDGSLSSEEIFNDEGNGAEYFAPPGFKSIKNIIVTGPNRNIFARTGLKVHYSAVAGDMMMSGPVGMVRAFRKIYGC